MAKIRVTRFFEFEMAHALWNYDGLCRNIHGHSYKLYITVMGEPVQNDQHPKNGMVIDFGDLKRIVKQEIVDRFDHSLMMYQKSPHQVLIELGNMYERHHLVQFQPTCENMVEYIAEKIIPLLPEGIILKNVKLFETANSCAEWLADDNL
jgi:6-pyruvoyltetrahydropterin/6-carboxytetrahydropterin synthase